MTGEPSISDEDLMRLADGEARADEEKALRAAIATDPRLASRYAAFVETRAAIQPNTTNPVQPAPASLVAAILRADAQVAASMGGLAASAETGRGVADRKAQSGRRPDWLVSSRMALPLAASVALLMGCAAGFFLGQEQGKGGAGLDVASRGLLSVGGAAEALATGLGRIPSGASAAWSDPATGASGTLTMIGTYATAAGEVCREYRITVSEGRDGQFAGASCRQDGVWRIQILAAEPGVEPGSYGTATGSVAVEDYLAGLGAGTRLSPEDEARRLR